MSFILMFFLFTNKPTIYPFSFISTDGRVINLNDYQGKKILIVNTARKSKYVDQYGKLEQLYQKYKDSLVIIAFPSNSFSHEDLSDSLNDNFVTGKYNRHFVLAKSVIVRDIGQHPIYQWLTQVSQNQMQGAEITDDFFKFLVDPTGRLIGVFSSTEDPMGGVIENVIKSATPN